MDRSQIPNQKTSTTIKKSENELPSYFDWRKHGKVTTVKNQQQCGSCWAFSAVAAIESAYAIKTNILENFSEQQLVDCSTENNGCNGGLPWIGMEYVKKAGIMKYVDYPYIGRQEQCRYSPTDVVTISDIYGVGKNEEDMKQALVDYCPVSIGINASARSFQFYSSGVYYDSHVNSNAIDHAVLCVGYGQTNGDNFWIIKNSWGNSWGVEGYIYVERTGNDFLGVTTCGVIPVI